MKEKSAFSGSNAEFMEEFKSYTGIEIHTNVLKKMMKKHRSELEENGVTFEDCKRNTTAVSISATTHRLTIAEKYGKYGRYGKCPREILLSLPSLLSEPSDSVILLSLPSLLSEPSDSVVAPCVPLCGLFYRRLRNKPTAKHVRIWANVGALSPLIKTR